MNKYVALLIAAVVLFGAGFYAGKGQTQVEIQEKVVYRDSETRVEYRDRTVTVTKIVRPDGTTEETTRTEEKEKSEETTIVERDRQKEKLTTLVLSDYSLGLKYWASLSDKLDIRDRNNYELTAARRLIGEVWVQGGVRMDKSVAVGLSVQF